LTVGEGQIVALVVQGGFAGLVAIFVYHGFKREERMATRMNSVEDRSLTALENNTKAITELTTTLNHRPCLIEDPAKRK
jgi:hypothetical protein